MAQTPVRPPPLRIGTQHDATTAGAQRTNSLTSPKTVPQDNGEGSLDRSSRSGTPTSPPYSPITPTAVAGQLASMKPYNAPSVIKRPPAVPISESENSDVVALRATIELLQLQKQTSTMDIQTLRKMRETMLADPTRWVDELTKRAREKGPEGDSKDDMLAPTLKYVTDELRKDVSKVATERKDSHVEESSDEEEELPRAPQAQNVFRMPPINWAKYQVVGESLDKLHEEQRARPAGGQPHVEPNSTSRADPYVMAAPYDPYLDPNKGEHPMQTRKGSKKPI